MVNWYPGQTVGQLPREAARRWGAREALEFRGRRWSHAQVDREVDAHAKSLIALGVRAQEKVALWLVNGPELFFLFYAVMKVGAVAVPLNTRYRTEELAVALRKADCSFLFAMDRCGPVPYGAMVADALRAQEFPHLRRIVMIGDEPVSGSLAWQRFAALATELDDAQLAARAASVDPDAVAMIIYTSGTTAQPKGVMHSHICVRAMQERPLAFGMTCGDVILNYLPLFHLFGISLMMSAILCGARQVVMDKFDGEQAMDLVDREGVTMAFGFDTHWLAMLDAHRARPRRVQTLRIGQCASGSDDAIVNAYKVQELCLTASGYGMAECWSWNALCFPNSTAQQRCETSGIAMPGVEFRILDSETGQPMPDGELGEIWVSSYTNMLGYYGEPDATAAVFDGRWLRTGDKGRLRTDGYLQFVGRYKDMLKVGGENVAPAEVEAFLLTLDGVAQVAVVGMPHSQLHEVPVAFIVAHEPVRIDAQSVLASCKGRMASFKIPRIVHFVKELPMTTTGKVQKQELRQRALAATA